MTREEAISELKYARAMCEFNPTTGEVCFRNEEDRRQAEALDMAIEALKAQEWIPCSEDQPTEEIGRVIYCDENGEVGMGLHSEFSDTWYKGDMCGVGGAKVIAWMPKPKPYKE